MTRATGNVETSPTKSSWAGVVAIAFGAFALVVTEFLPVGVLPEMSATYGISEGTGGLTVTATALLGALSAPVATLAIRRLDRRTVLLALGLLLIVSSALTALAPSFAVVVVARILLGLAIGAFWAISISGATRLVPPTRGAAASSLVLGGISIGSVISVPAGSLIASVGDWRAAFWAACALAVVSFLVQLVVVPRIVAEHAVTIGHFFGLFRDRRIVAVLLAVVLVVGGHYVAYTFINPYLQSVTGVDAGTLSALLLGYGAVTVVGNFIGGGLAGRAVYRTVLGSAVVFAVALIAMAVFGTVFAAAIVALGLWALAWGAMPVGTQLWLFGLAREDHPIEAAQAMNTSVFQLSIGLGSLVGSLTVDGDGLGAAMGVAAVVLLVAVAVIAIASRLVRRADPVETRPAASAVRLD